MQSKYGLSLAHDLEQNAYRFGDVEAFVIGQQRLTHGQFLTRAQQLASAWRQLGLKRQDRISVLAQNCPEFIEVYGAGEWAGYITATVNFRLAAPEMTYVINHASAKMLVFESSYADTIERIKSQLSSVQHFVCIASDSAAVPSWASTYSDVLASGDSDDTAVERSRPDDFAYLIYTSGTTGRPKGCVHRHGSVRAWAQVMALAHENRETDRMLLMMPFFHVGAKFMQLSQHAVGGTVYIQRGFDAEAVLKCVSEERITVTHMAPTLVQALLDHPELGRYDIKSLRTIVYGAAPMSPPVLRKGIELLGDVFIQTYGQTETIGTSLARHEHRPDGTPAQVERLRSIGRPYANTELRIVTDDGTECSSGVPGEIVIRSEAQFAAYWNNSAATLETLQDGWVRTGDVGKRDADGFLYLVDRKKDVIISGGENIYSREVEDAISLHPAVRECAVIGIPDETWGEAVCAAVVCAEGKTVTEQELIEHCKQQIASYKKPKRVVFMDSLPRLPSGKVSKVELRKLC